MTKLALHGGEPLRHPPLDPNRLRPLRFDHREKQALLRVVDSGVMCRTFGREADCFEREAAALFGMPHAVASSSGTAAIHTALAASGVGWGDEVVTSPVTDQGTVIAIVAQGARPVFADIDERTFNLTTESVEAVLTPRTRAILAVHLAGLSAGIEPICELGRSRGLPVIEDCAQSWFAASGGHLAGTFGAIGCFSLNGYKHIECGDGGLCVTRDPELARRMRLFTDKCYDRVKGLRNPGFFGMNYRMTELQAAVARVQLDKLESIVTRRRAIAGRLLTDLAGTPGLILPRPPAGSDHAWWYFILRANRRSLGAPTLELAEALAAEGLPTWSGYGGGQPVYLYDCFQNSAESPFRLPPLDPEGRPIEELYPRGLCPVAEAMLKEIIILSLNEHYSPQDVDDLVGGIRKVFTWYSGAESHSG